MFPFNCFGETFLWRAVLGGLLETRFQAAVSSWGHAMSSTGENHRCVQVGSDTEIPPGLIIQV